MDRRATLGGLAAALFAGAAWPQNLTRRVALLTAPNRRELATVPGASNFVRANFPSALPAMKAVKGGTGDCIVIWMGDSTSFGADDTPYTNARTHSPAFQTATALNAFSVPASADSFIGNGNAVNMTNYALADSRISYTGTGWTTDQTSGLEIAGGFPVHQDTNLTGTMAFQTGQSQTSCRIFFIQAGGIGSIAWSVDGGGETTFGTSGADGIGSQAVSLGSSATHSLKLRQAVSGNVFTAGMIFTNSAVRRLVLVNAGASSWNYSQWAIGTSGWSPGAGSPANYAQYGGKLVFLNNMINSGNDAGTFAALQTEITNLKAAGADVIVVNPQRTSNAVSEAQQDANRASLLALAIANSCAFLDLAYFYTSYATWAAAGFSAGTGAGAGGVHPNAAGYGYIAGLQAAVLQALYNAA